ncbi:MAG: hypothetical protein R3B47_08125 [Bacteroidia bacterium]
MSGYIVSMKAIHASNYDRGRLDESVLRKEYCLAVMDSLAYCQEHKGLAVRLCHYAESFTPDCIGEGALLSGIIRDFKQFAETHQTHPGDTGYRREWLYLQVPQPITL